MRPLWIGYLGAGVAFLLVGAGLHTVQTVGLALATDLAPVESQPKVVGLMYVMLLFGMIVSALGFGAFLADFTPGRLVQVIQGAAVATIVLNGISLWKQETRGQALRTPSARRATEFRRVLGQLHPGRPGDPPPRRRRPRHDGVQHGGRPARAIWRAGPAAGGRRHHEADGRARGRRTVRLLARVAQSSAAARTRSAWRVSARWSASPPSAW